MEEYQLATPCGHKANVKPVQKAGGLMQGKWCCRISGPAVQGKSGVKTVYSDPNVNSAKRKIAAFLRISPSQIVERAAERASSVPKPAFSTGTASKTSRQHQSSTQMTDAIVSVRANLQEALRNMRSNLARAKNLPPYCIFDDESLDEIVAKLPLNQAELLTVRGMEKIKVEEYGSAIFEGFDMKGSLCIKGHHQKIILSMYEAQDTVAQ